MNDEKEKQVKDGVKKGVSIVGKVIKWVLIAILIIIVLVVGYSVYTCTAVTKAVVDVASGSKLVKDAVRDATGGEDPQKMASEAISASAANLWSAYDANAVKADNTYKGKAVRLTGKVSKVDKDLFDRPYVAFECTPYLDFVHVYFKGSETSKLADVDNGQTITIVGICEGKAAVSVEIKDAFFE
jgi:flagellar basal body-associated protein FliL